MLHGAFQILFAILNVEEREVGVTDGSASPAAPLLSTAGQNENGTINHAKYALRPF